MEDENRVQLADAEMAEERDLLNVFEGYALVLGLMGKILYVNPEYDWINELATDGVFDELPLLAVNEDALAGWELLKAWAGDTGTELSTSIVDEVKCDYVPVFLNGKDGALAPPWESIYVNSSPAFFQCSTMSVRMWYKRYNLAALNQEHEPDDHIGLELAFLSRLCAIVAGVVDAPVIDGEVRAMGAVRSDVNEFANKHLFNWATHWCDMVIERANTDFYRGAALLTKGTLACLAAEFGEEISPNVFR